ncbi:hypothetical protein ACJ41O_006051 [Fusarium nematophilum]
MPEGPPGTAFTPVDRPQWPLAFSADSTFVAGFGGRHINVFDVATRRLKKNFQIFAERCSSVAFSSEGSLMAVASKEGLVQIWAWRSRDILVEISRVGRWPGDLSFLTGNAGIRTSYGVMMFPEEALGPSIRGLPIRELAFVPVLGVDFDLNWIKSAGRNLLRLPAKCREGEVMVSGSTVAIGCKSGKVIIMRFSGQELSGCLA